ncbi:MAG: hypothetical protein ACI358_01300 [Candidatus Limimorpha sp.]
MRKIILSFFLLLVGCSNIGKHNHNLCVEPLEPAIHLDSLGDCTMSVAFKGSDFNWDECCLTMRVYSELLYDALEVGALKTGDTIIHDGVGITIKSIEHDGRHCVVNGGIEQGGLELVSNGGGTFRSVTFDDHSVYKFLGETTVTFGDDLVITDCGENPNDSCVKVRNRHKDYIDSLPEYRIDFIPLNTSVRIENGMLKEINRRWIP